MNADTLRDSVLQKAMEGKLVPQLKEEAEVVQIGDVSEEAPFEIPKKWKWVNLELLCHYIQRGKSPIYSDKKQIPVIAQKCNQWDGFSIEKAKFIEPNSLSKYAPERRLQDFDILWNSTGLGTLGRLALYETRLNPYGVAVADSHVTVIRTNNQLLDPHFLYWFLRSPSVQHSIEQLADGSTKQKELATKTIKSFPIPVPSIDEQKRIVKKIEELLPLIEEYGRDQEQLEKINKDFPIQMEKSLLQEAISGRLVPQLDEEPELQQIGEAPEEAPFRIPTKWKWVKLSSIASSNVGLTYKPTDLIDDLSGTPVLRSNNIQDGKLNLKDLKRVKYANPSPKNFVHPGDLLMCARNGSKRLVGKCCLIPELKERMMFGAFMAVIRSDFAPYLHIFFSSDAFKKYLGSVSTTTINQITQKNLLNTWIPLPPLEEQNRIVEKFDKLMLEIQKLK